MLVAQKRKHVHKTLQEKCQALKGIEKGLPKKDVATKYGVPKNTISTQIKNKDKILSSLEKGQNEKSVNQKKSWMDGALFEECVRELDRKFVSEGRSIALVIDNCPAHPPPSH